MDTRFKNAVRISKKQQVEVLLNELRNTITRSNVDECIPILEWTKTKISLQEAEKTRQFRNSKPPHIAPPRAVNRGEIYGAVLGRNIGSEQNGKSRPVIIVQETKHSQNSPTIIVAPLTDAHDKNGNLKRLQATHVLFSHSKLSKESVIKLEHMKCISKNRLNGIMCTVEDTKDLMQEVDQKIIQTLSIK